MISQLANRHHEEKGEERKFFPNMNRNAAQGEKLRVGYAVVINSITCRSGGAGLGMGFPSATRMQALEAGGAGLGMGFPSATRMPALEAGGAGLGMGFPSEIKQGAGVT
jgi:hypothetical protein